MYAVIATGGKQEKVEKGQVLEVERLGEAENSLVKLRPVLVVDGDNITTAASDLAKFEVTAKVLGESKGKKINGFTYKNKSNQRKRWGHRQKYTRVEITGISAGKK